MKIARGIVVWCVLGSAACGARICVKLSGSAFGVKGKIKVCGEGAAPTAPDPVGAHVVEAVAVDGGAGDAVR